MSCCKRKIVGLISRLAVSPFFSLFLFLSFVYFFFLSFSVIVCLSGLLFFLSLSFCLSILLVYIIACLSVLPLLFFFYLYHLLSSEFPYLSPLPPALSSYFPLELRFTPFSHLHFSSIFQSHAHSSFLSPSLSFPSPLPSILAPS